MSTENPSFHSSIPSFLFASLLGALMKRILFVSVCLTLIGLAGCHRSPTPSAPPTPPRQDAPAANQPGADHSSAQSIAPASSGAGVACVHRKADGERPDKWWSDLDVAIKEDAQGNVISVNTAANRSRVDNYQMQEILAFPASHPSWLRGPASITPSQLRSPNRRDWNRFPSKAH